MECTQLSLFGRTYQELFPATAEKISEPCWKSLPAWNSQTLLFLDLRGGADGAKPEQSPERDGALLGDSSTLNIGESPSVENESLLSQILEANAPLKYYLSERACQGILTRASRRGKALPDLLKTALLEMIEWWQRGGRNAAYTLKIRSGCAGGGKGALVQTEKTGTLSTLQDQTLFQPAAAYKVQVLNDQGGGKMDVSYDVVGTLRANAKGHDPIVIDVLPFDTTQLTSPQNGSNPHWGDPCHPLAASAHTPSAVVKVFDAQGNGDGQIVPTITGDHKSRITDYTAIAVDLYNGAATGDTATSITCRSIASHSGPQVMESYGIGNGQAHSSVTKEKSGTLDTMHDAQAVAIEHAGCLTPWDVQSRRIFSEYGKWPALYSGEGGGHGYVFTLQWIVRRLTPMECERLQGYPDGWTDIGEWTDTKGKKHKAADSPRYKALGNSIALPQWFWIVQKMKPYMRDGAKLGSLFDGIGGFPLVWETTYGAGTAAWASEIEEFPIAVTKKWFGEKEVKS
jgi:DNA (cytosine-5)-methyltransferase 1